MTNDLLQQQVWKLATLGEVAEVNPRKPKYTGLKGDSLVGFIPMAAVDETRGVVSTVEERSLGELRGKSYRTFASGDVLFAKITPCMENGKAAVVPGIPSGQGFGSTEFHVLRPGDKVDARYLWHFVRQETYRREAERHMTGSVGQLRVPAEFLRDTKLPLPPISEQRRIVDVLDRVVEGRQAAAVSISQARVAIIASRRAILAAACSGRLTAGWRAEHNVAISDGWMDELKNRVSARPSRRPKSSQSAGLSSESQLEECPKSWRLVRIGDIFEIATGATPLRKNDAYYVGGTIPWVTSGAVNAGLIAEPSELITPLAIKETNAKVFPPGTLLVAMYGEGQTRGRVAELGIEAATNQAVAALLFNPANEVLRNYVRLFFEESYQRIRSLSFGGVQPNLSLGVIKDTLIPLPPIAEQKEIVRQTDSLLAGSEETLTKAGATSLFIERAGQATLAKAFRGELLEAEE